MADSLEALFTNEEYVTQEFQLGPTKLRLKTLKAASTDYDLTGQILWPAAHLLAEYLAKNLSIMQTRSNAVEIGSGLGLVGLLCAQHCSTVLTDHNPVVLKVLQENAGLNPSPYPTRCKLMDWEKAEDIAHVRSIASQRQGYALVLASDVCYGLKALPFVFNAFSQLLSHEPGSLGLLGYVSRAAAIDRGIHEHAKKVGLDFREIPGSRQDVGGGLSGAVFAFQWPTTDKNAESRTARGTLLPSIGVSYRMTAIGVICGAVVLTFLFRRRKRSSAWSSHGR